MFSTRLTVTLVLSPLTVNHSHIIRTINMIFIGLIILITKGLGRVEGLAPIAPDESSNRNRDLKIGMLGTTPYFFVKDNRIMGSDMLMVQLLSEKMGFSYELNVVRTFEKLVFMVSQMLLYTLTNNICLTSFLLFSDI